MNPNNDTTFPTLFSPDQNQPPNSYEAEQAFLGSILISGGWDTDNKGKPFDILLEAQTFLTPQHFFLAKHAWIWEAILAIRERGHAIENMTVTLEMNHRKQLEDIGGPAYITELTINTPTHIHWKTYARLIQGTALRRFLLDAAGDIAKIALEENAETQVVLDEADSILHQVTRVRLKPEKDTLVPISQIANQHFDDLDRRSQEYDRNQEQGVITNTGIMSGFFDLDYLIEGWQPGNLVYVAARPGAGKTSLMLAFALYAAKYQDKTVAVFSKEMTSYDLYSRLASMESGVDTRKFRKGNVSPDEWSAYTSAMEVLHKLPIFIDDETRTTGKMRKEIKKLGKVDLIIDDYIQISRPTDDKDRPIKTNNKSEAVSILSNQYKEMAMVFKVPLISGCQLNRDVEQRSDKRPILSDLNWSGSLEQDTDIALGISRPEMYDENTERPNQADLIVMKQRNGPTGSCTVYFRKELTQFTNMRTDRVNVG